MSLRTAQIRASSSQSLHAIAFSLRATSMRQDLTRAQEWLWRVVIRELVRRQRRELSWRTRCFCELCRESVHVHDFDEGTLASP